MITTKSTNGHEADVDASDRGTAKGANRRKISRRPWLVACSPERELGDDRNSWDRQDACATEGRREQVDAGLRTASVCVA